MRADLKKVTARLEKNIERVPMSGCWVWVGACDRDGYSRMSIDGRVRMAHRVSYESYAGKIPDGLTIDHLCRVRCCINPTHLEAVTHKVNTLRGTSVSAINKAKTHCANGHEFTDDNTYSKNGRRQCRTCKIAVGKYMVDRKCENCGSAFQAKKADVKRGWGRFCSKSCKSKSHMAMRKTIGAQHV